MSEEHVRMVTTRFDPDTNTITEGGLISASADRLAEIQEARGRHWRVKVSANGRAYMAVVSAVYVAAATWTAEFTDPLPL